VLNKYFYFKTVKFSVSTFCSQFLQLENILLDDNFNSKLSDFGFASYIDTDNQLTGILCEVIG